jgi:dTDP-4-amino-4,6-dideoxygalactose transaminase
MCCPPLVSSLGHEEGVSLKMSPTLTYQIPFVDPREHYRRYKAELEQTIVDTLSRGDLVLRQQLRDFERNLAAVVGARHAVGVGSGYHALHLSMLAAGIGSGDEVITVAHTFVATISAIVHCGATPVLVDVRDDYNMDPDAFEAAITPRTRAVVPVHLNGRICEMDRIMAIADRHGLLVIEDAAQALGATFEGTGSGAWGAAGCFSFYPFKLLGCFGDGGAVTTRDTAIARTVTLLRFNGEDRETGEYFHHGYTALLDNLQAAVLDVKLRHLTDWIDHRRNIAECYRAGLEGAGDLRLPHWNDPRFEDVYQNYVVRTSHRAALREHLCESGVETLLHWPKPVWRHKALGLGEWRLPKTEAICEEVFSLPMSAETTEDQAGCVVNATRRFFK